MIARQVMRVILFIVIINFAVACDPVISDPVPTMTETIAEMRETATPKPSLTITNTPSPIPTATNTQTKTATASPTTTATFTITPKPTYIVLRGTVNQERVNCYYGPSEAYLYKYGLLKESRLDVIGFMPDTGYIQVQAIGGDNPCWMKLELMDVRGEISNVMPVDPMDIKLPWSPYYPGLSFAKAERTGPEVTVSWSPLVLKPGDSSDQEAYLLEAWVCRDGQRTFVPLGVNENTVKVMDEPGCQEPSFGRVYGVEKHGYTKYLMFDWPQAGDPM
ncbi:MAG: hypothetical protein GX577_02555 [Leptolinea sp.]|nr:hypothetical protein [Leptolinea sp.]